MEFRSMCLATRTSTFLTLLSVLGQFPPAAAHPHVTGLMTIEVVYNDQGAIAALRHEWIFDEIFSTVATSRLVINGTVAQDKLATLADSYIASLKPNDYFTYGTADGAKVSFGQPMQHSLELRSGRLALQFTLPLISPVPAALFEVQIYDRTYFVQLKFSSQTPIRLTGGRAACRYDVEDPAPAKNVDEAFFSSLSRTSDWAAQFAARFKVHCSG
jgi:ABC-type uncharacterized transport system substrate-binding protein